VIINVIEVGAAVLLVNMDGMPGKEPSPVNAFFLKETGFRDGTILMMAKRHFFVCLGQHPAVQIFVHAFTVAVNAKYIYAVVAGIIAFSLFTGISKDPDEVVKAVKMDVTVIHGTPETDKS